MEELDMDSVTTDKLCRTRDRNSVTMTKFVISKIEREREKERDA